MINKLIRTIIGLPVALFLWPIGLFYGVLWMPTTFVIYGECNTLDKEMTLFCLTLPYHFIKKVWA